MGIAPEAADHHIVAGPLANSYFYLSNVTAPGRRVSSKTGSGVLR